MTLTGKFVCIRLTISSCCASILLTLMLIGRNGGLRTLLQLQVWLSAWGAKNVSWPWPSLLRGWSSLSMVFTGKFVWLWLTISSCHGSISLTLVLISRDCGLRTLCKTYGFDSQQRVLKTFPGPGYLSSKDGIVSLWHSLINYYVYGSPIHLPTAKSLWPWSW